MGNDELSYCELRSKEVVNATDGKRMGRIVDIMFSRSDGTVCGIVVPLTRKGVFSKNQDVFIPWRCVSKIGEDVILINLTVEADGRVTCTREQSPPPPPPPPHKGRGYESKPPESGCTARPECDNRCEKCMLFDCANRWSHIS